MHEMSVLNSLMNKVNTLSAVHAPARVVSLRVRLGALSHFTPEHFQEHFNIASRNTAAEGAALHVILMTDVLDPDAQGVVLESIEFDS